MSFGTHWNVSLASLEHIYDEDLAHPFRLRTALKLGGVSVATEIYAHFKREFLLP